MPYSIRRKGTKFEVIKVDDGKSMGEHDSREKAQAQIAAIEANENKSIDLSYVKSMGLDLSAELLAVKSIGADTIRGYMALWGNPEMTDIEAEYFTPQTDFWDVALKSFTRPLTWDHAQDDETKSNPIIGTIQEMGDDKTGRWYTAQLDRAHKYRKAVDKLIESGRLGTSSDSAPQYVLREQRGKSTWLKRWPLFAAALTPTPCEPRMFGSVEYAKSLGLSLPDQPGVSCPEQAGRLQFLKDFYISTR
jgi:hypothetical protein